MKTRIVALCCLWSAVITLSCNSGTVPSSSDCYDSKHPFKADFSIFESVHSNLTATDTVLNYNKTVFVASPNCDSVVWIIGNDLRRWYTDTLSLRFTQSIGERIPITLISRKFHDCGSVREEFDTVVKILTVVDAKQSSLIGSFKGYHDGNVSDTQTVSIVFKSWVGGTTDSSFSFVNLQKCLEPGPLVDQPTFTYFTGYRSLYFDGTGSQPSGPCGNPVGTAVYERSHETLLVTYKTSDSVKYVNGKWLEYYRERKFQGTRQ